MRQLWLIFSPRNNWITWITWEYSPHTCLYVHKRMCLDGNYIIFLVDFYSQSWKKTQILAAYNPLQKQGKNYQNSIIFFFSLGELLRSFYSQMLYYNVIFGQCFSCVSDQCRSVRSSGVSLFVILLLRANPIHLWLPLQQRQSEMKLSTGNLPSSE